MLKSQHTWTEAFFEKTNPIIFKKIDSHRGKIVLSNGQITFLKPH